MKFCFSKLAKSDIAIDSKYTDKINDIVLKIADHKFGHW